MCVWGCLCVCVYTYIPTHTYVRRYMSKYSHPYMHTITSEQNICRNKVGVFGLPSIISVNKDDT